MTRSASVLMLLVALSAIGFPTWGQAAPVREFVPVQSGHASQGAAVPLYAPGRVIVQFTSQAMQNARFEVPLEKGATVPGARTGLASVDALLAEATALQISRSHGELKNKELARELGVDRWFRIEVPAGTDIPALAARLQADPNLEHAVPDYVAFPASFPNDPLYADHWGHNNTAQLPGFDWGGTWDHTGAPVGTVGFDANAESAWDGFQGYGDPGVVIAILDSGVDSTHPDLNQVTGYDFGDSDADPHDDSAEPGHGTACAGVAAAIANNSLGAAGIAGGCSIMPCKVADSAGTMYFSYIRNAVYYAADNGADVISMSLGAAIPSDPATDTALTYAFNAGVVILAATGNENASTISYPAIHSKVIGVGAASPCGDRKRSSNKSSEVNPGVDTDPNGYTCDGERWWGSNYGNTTQDAAGAVDIIAPTILPTTDIQGSGGYAAGDYSMFFNGTSCATPYAAGVAALVKSANPSWGPQQIRDQLCDTAQDVVNVESGAGWDRYSGYGMVDADAAIGGGLAAPTADFTASATTGCMPFTVTFTDWSQGTVTGWSWDFGDGQTSTEQHPSHMFILPGSYTVSLTASGPLGDDTLTVTDMITVQTAPAADYTLDPVSGTAPLTVDFTDASLNGPTSWSWAFGDGTLSTEQNPSHTFTTPGTYTISLVVTNDCGQDIETKIGVLTVEAVAAPVAGFSADPVLGCAPLETAFSDASTGDITDWLWDFGDGQTSTAQNPAHTYADPGSYTVSLTVTGPGGEDTMTAADLVFVGGPPAAAFARSDTTGLAPLSVDFTDQSTGGTSSWDWDFGDGGTSTDQNPTYVFSTAGDFQVRLIAANGCGADTAFANVEVILPEGPGAAFSADPVSSCAPLMVTFTDESAGDITGWAWNFGDGQTDTVQHPSHTYPTPGSFDVTLIVFGPGGADTLTTAGMITVSGPPTAAFSAGTGDGPVPLTVNFTDESTGGATSWAWDFGDGQTDTLQNPSHTYTEQGTFTVTLTAANACGSDILVMSDVVIVRSPSGVGTGLPLAFGLGRNYPNPFNPTTTIVFTLAKAGHARLEVFDATGRRVDTLVSADLGEGEHRVTWQPVSLASGVYFARLSAGGEIATQRMVLVR